jgi:hypothetical protein
MHQGITAFVPSLALLGGRGTAPHQQKAGARTMIDPSAAPTRCGVARRHDVHTRTISAESGRCNSQAATIS